MIGGHFLCCKYRRSQPQPTACLEAQNFPKNIMVTSVLGRVVIYVSQSKSSLTVLCIVLLAIPEVDTMAPAALLQPSVGAGKGQKAYSYEQLLRFMQLFPGKHSIVSVSIRLVGSDSDPSHVQILKCAVLSVDVLGRDWQAVDSGRAGSPYTGASV